MAQQKDQQQIDPVVAAIERVLKTERDGATALQHSREHGERILSEARARAAAIATRADARIARVYGDYLQKVQREIDKRIQSARSAGEHDAAHDRAMLVEAVRRVAAKLTSET